MQFEGSFQLDASRASVWQTLTDCEVLSRITPHVTSYRVIEPNKKFITQSRLNLGGQEATLETEIEWLEITAPAYLHILTNTVWHGQCVTVDGKIWLEDVGETELRFSAEINNGKIPAHLVHTMMGRILKTFFTNLKREAEAQQSSAQQDH